MEDVFKYMRITLKLILILFINYFSLNSCINKNKVQKKTNKTISLNKNNKTKEIAENQKDNQNRVLDLKKLNFNKTKFIIYYQDTLPIKLKNKCDDWFYKISKQKNISSILSEMKKVTPNEWYSMCYFPSACSIKLHEVFYDGQIFSDSIKIYSNSSIQISNNWFILDKVSEDFLVPCSCCEDENINDSIFQNIPQKK